MPLSTQETIEAALAAAHQVIADGLKDVGVGGLIRLYATPEGSALMDRLNAALTALEPVASPVWVLS